jgi:hypothetical protein
MKNFIDTMGNRTRDFPAFSAVPQPTASPHAPVRCTQILKRPTNALGFVNVILLHINHRHVSATRVAIFRVVRIRMQLQ